MIVNIKLTKEEKILANKYAKLIGISLSRAMKRAYFEQIENDLEIKLFNSSYNEFLKDNISISFDKVKEEIGL